MFWAGSSVHDLFTAFLVVTTIGLFTSTCLRLAGWPAWARIAVIIPIVAVAARLAGRVLSNTTFIFLH